MENIPLDNTDQPEFENQSTNIKTDSMPENKVILETPAGKYVPLELLERALSEWNGRRKKPLTNDMLFQIFRNEFPELNLQVVGHAVKAV